MENRWNLHQIKRFAYSRDCGSRVKNFGFPDSEADMPTAYWKSCGQLERIVEKSGKKLTSLWKRLNVGDGWLATQTLQRDLHLSDALCERAVFLHHFGDSLEAMDHCRVIASAERCANLDQLHAQ